MVKLGSLLSVNRILDVLFLLLTVVQLSFLFMIFELVGVSTSTFNLISTVFYLFYILVHLRALAKVMLWPISQILLFVTLLLPLIVSIVNSVFYDEIFDSRALGVRFLMCLIYISTLVFCRRKGLIKFNLVIVWSIFIVIVGLLLSLFNQELFYPFVEDRHAISVMSGRAFGFYLQPNTAATSLSALFLSYVCINFRNVNVILVTLIFVGILLTASRAGILIFVILYTFVFLYLNEKDIIFTTVRKAPVILVIGSIALVFLLMIAQGYEKFSKNDNYTFTASQRLTSISSIFIDDSSSEILNDSDNRLGLAKAYIDFIYLRPEGYGLGATERYKTAGFFDNSPHNQFVQVAFQAGVFGLIMYVILVIKIPLRTKDRSIMVLGVSIAIFLVLNSLVSNTLLINRVVYLMLALYIVSSKQRFAYFVRSSEKAN